MIDVRAQLSETAEQWRDARTLSEAAQVTAACAAASIPVAGLAGVTLVRKSGDVSTLAATDTCIAELDAAQVTSGGGPLAELWDSPSMLVDIAHEYRWEGWVSRLRALDVGSVLCFRLGMPAHRLHVLSIYTRGADAFSDGDCQLAAAIAAVAAGAVAAFERTETLEQALVNRDTIGMAKGVLMNQYKITADEAFRMLVAASQRGNVKLHAVARVVAETGELPMRQSGIASSAASLPSDVLRGAHRLNLRVTA
jgi:GAF domain-containing protein